MIDLAPRNPYGLQLTARVIVAPGCAAPLRDPDPALIGAICTPPTVLHTTHVDHPTTRARWAATPAGVVFERLPVARFRKLVQTENKRWLRSPVPVLLTLRGDTAELATMAERLESLEGIAGLMIDARESSERRAEAIAAVRDRTALPILALLESIDEAAALHESGADALVARAYPQAGGMSHDGPITGALVGPSLAPHTLHALDQLRLTTDAPLIALGGVADASIAHACLHAGATAVMIDGALYGDPDAPRRIGAGLSPSTANAGASA
jgi:NAD(P)H-dependent flavin oxidoreductase YrpB (nitropropane dioxygenase family)